MYVRVFCVYLLNHILGTILPGSELNLTTYFLLGLGCGLELGNYRL